MVFGVTRYGRRELVIATLLAAALCAVFVWLGLHRHWAFFVGAGICTAGWAGVLAFFRDPQREAPSGEGLFVSPADGRVADITQIGPDSLLGCDGVKVGIFMSILDVHVNRSPADARVDSVEHKDGQFLDARRPGAACRNESTTIGMTYAWGAGEYPIVVRQIAGLVARRIVTDLEVGQRVTRSQRIGMIKFGSRLELLVPRELARRVLVRVGQRVVAGQTVLVAGPQETAG